MKNIKEYIIESNANKVIFDACMELDNNSDIYKHHFKPLIDNLVKKYKKGEFEIEKLEKSSVISKLCQIVLHKVNGHLTGEDRKRLTKFVTACVIKGVENEGELNLTKEEEDYRIEWDYANSDKCGW